MKKVVSHPKVSDWRLRGNGLESRVRADERHRGKPTVVRDSHDANASVIMRHVLNEPVNRVVSVRALVDRLHVARVPWRAHHYELSFGIKLPTDVLKDEDVAVCYELGVGKIYCFAL